MTTSTSVVMEDSNQKGDSDTASKNNVGSFVKINSISIEIADVTNKNYTDKCEHFSIREYVAEVRKKNWRLCWPFPLDDEENKFTDQASFLPPLTSPKFRWWSCQKCTEKIGCGGEEKGHGTRSNNFVITSESKSDCPPQISSPCTTVMHEPDVHEAPKTNLVEKVQSDRDKTTVVVAEAHTSFIGPKRRTSEFPIATNVPVEINLNVMQENLEYETVAESRECLEARPIDLSKHGRGKCDVTDVEAATIPNSVGEHGNKLHIASGASVVACSNDGASNANFNGHVSGLLNECDNGSSDNSEIVRSNSQGHNQPSPRGPLRRKTRKVRLLTDLLFDSRDTKVEPVSKSVSPVSAVNGVPTEARARVASVPQVQVSLPDNHKEAVPVDSRKRKLLPFEERRSTEMMSLPINLDKKGKSLKDDAANSAMADSGMKQVTAATGLYVQSGNRTHWSKYGSERVFTDTKKKKRSQTTDVRPYLVPVGEYFPSPSSDQLGISSKQGISFRAVNDASSGRGMDRIPLTVPRKEHQPNSHKSKSKSPLVDGRKSSQYPWNSSGLVKQVPITRDRESTQTGPLTVSFRQAEDASINTGLQLSLGSSAAPKKGGKKYTPEVGDGKSTGYWQQGLTVNETVMKNIERNYISESTIPTKTGTYGLFKKQAHDDVSGQLITYNVPAQNVKQNNNIHIDGRRSLGKQVDISGTSNYQKSTKVKEHPAVSRKRIVEKADKVSDKGPSDEIPMDVVEILAHIQYEKGQQNHDNYSRQIKAANQRGPIPMPDYDKVYRTEKLITSEEANRRTNSLARNERSGKNVKPSKRKPVDYFPNGNGDHLSHPVQKKSSSSGICAELAATKCSCADNCKWNVNLLGHGFFTLGEQRRECETCPIVPQLNEEASPWSAVAPIEMPKRYNNLPQNGVPQRQTNLQIGSSTPGLLRKSDFINKEHELRFSKHSATTNLEIPGQRVSSETFGRRNAAEYSLVNKHSGIEPQQSLRGSLDLYSNETIPAMHLLSLMTAGASSSPCTNLNTSNPNIGGNTRFFQRDCVPDNSYDQYPQATQLGLYSKSRDIVKHTLDYHGKSQLSVKPHDFFPVNPVAGPSTPSFRRERDNDGFMDQVSFSSRGKEKVQMSLGAPSKNRGRKHPISAFSTGGFLPNHIPMSGRDFQKGLLFASTSSMALVPSSPMLLPLQSHGPEYATELQLGTPHATGALRPARSDPESLVCVVNRNPADFSYPEAGNEFMIRGEDLKVRKPRKRRASTTTPDQRKRQKNNNGKRITDKEQA